MSQSNTEDAPVVIGGVGGSGTRLPARILIELGYHLGFDLNPACDNLWVSLLLTCPRWHTADWAKHSEEMGSMFSILKKATLGPVGFTAAERRLIADVAASHERDVSVRQPDRKGFFERIADRLCHSGATDPRSSRGAAVETQRLADRGSAPERRQLVGDASSSE